MIFIGHLDRAETAWHPGRKWGFTHNSTPSYETHKAWIYVDESFKGAKAGDVFIYAQNEGNCSFEFQARDTEGQWLFYARAMPNSQTVHLSCSRTRRLSDAAADLLFLRSLPDSETKNRLSGTVSRVQELGAGMFDKTLTVSGIRLTILGKSYKREITTDANGVFDLTELVPGNYTVQLDVPNSDLIYMAYSIGGLAGRISNGQLRERTQSVLIGAQDGVEVDFVLISKAIVATSSKSHH